MRALPFALLLAACHIEEAPSTLDEAFHAWWDGFSAASDADLAVVLRGTLDVVDLDAVAQAPLEGTQQPLGPEDVVDLTFTTADGAPTDPPDPSSARPLYVVSRVGCTLDAYVDIFTHDDQRELYGTYDGYERDYLTSKADFLDGTSDTMSWEGTIDQDASFLGAYSYTFRTDARVAHVGEQDGLVGTDVLMLKDWLPFPATWTRGEGAFPQDYQLEVWIPIADDELLHVYPIWRVLETSAGDMSSDMVANFNLGKMKDWDRKTEKLCKDGLP
jgi:hypothetical protein